MNSTFETLSGDLFAVQEAYQKMLEAKKHKHEKKDDKHTEKDVEAIAKELEKAADELKEGMYSSDRHSDLHDHAYDSMEASAHGNTRDRDIADDHIRSRHGEAALSHVKLAGSALARDDHAAHNEHMLNAHKSSMEHNGMLESTDISEAFGRGRVNDSRVATAFLDGRAVRGKTNPKDNDNYKAEYQSHTDGKTYFLHDHPIATKDDSGKITFDWNGYYTPTTERHMNTIINEIGKRNGEDWPRLVSKADHKKRGVDTFTLDDLKSKAD